MAFNRLLASSKAIRRISLQSSLQPALFTHSINYFGETAQLQRLKSDKSSKKARKMAIEAANADLLARQEASNAGIPMIPEAKVVVLTSREEEFDGEEGPREADRLAKMERDEELRQDFGRRLMKHVTRGAGLTMEDELSSGPKTNAESETDWVERSPEEFEARLKDIRAKINFYKSLDKDILGGNAGGQAKKARTYRGKRESQMTKRELRRARAARGEEIDESVGSQLAHETGVSDPSKVQSVLMTMLETGRLNGDLFTNILNFGRIKGFSLESMMPINASVSDTLGYMMNQVEFLKERSESETVETLFDYLMENMRDNVNEANRTEFWTDFRTNNEESRSFLDLIAMNYNHLEWLVDDLNDDSLRLTANHGHTQIPKKALYALMTQPNGAKGEYPLHTLFRHGNKWDSTKLHEIVYNLSPMDDSSDDFWSFNKTHDKKTFIHLLAGSHDKSMAEKTAICRVLARDYVSDESWQRMVTSRDKFHKCTPFETLLYNDCGESAPDELIQLLSPRETSKRAREFWLGDKRDADAGTVMHQVLGSAAVSPEQRRDIMAKIKDQFGSDFFNQLMDKPNYEGVPAKKYLKKSERKAAKHLFKDA